MAINPTIEITTDVFINRLDCGNELFGIVADESIEKISANLVSYLRREYVETIHEEYE